MPLSCYVWTPCADSRMANAIFPHLIPGLGISLALKDSDMRDNAT